MSTQRKAEQHKLIRARATAALRDLYHNATVSYPTRDDTGPHNCDDFQA